MIRSSFFIDGFNLYHALKRLNAPHLKWVDLNKLMQQQIARKTERIQSVFYFSAFAHWLPNETARHREYVNALSATGVSIVMGHFKSKPRHCLKCGVGWTQHEEKRLTSISRFTSSTKLIRITMIALISCHATVTLNRQST